MTAAEARRARAREEMRAQILEVARDALAREGATALSMRAIARSIGYSPAALYEYFPSKEDVLQALYFEGAEGLSGRMRSALAVLQPDAPAIARLEAQGIAYREAALAQSELYRFAVGGFAGFVPNEVNLNCSWDSFQLLVDTMRAGVESGEFVADEPGVLAVAAWSGVHGFVSLEIGGLIAQAPGKAGVSGLTREERDALYGVVLRSIGLGIMRRK